MEPSAYESQPPAPKNSAAIVGTIFSIAGAVGWVVVVLFRVPYDGARGVEGVVYDAAALGWNAFLLFLIGGLSAVMSFVGFVVGAVSVRGPKDRLTPVAIGIGIAGLIAGFAIFAWRMQWLVSR